MLKKGAFSHWVRRHWKVTAAVLVVVMGVSLLLPAAVGADTTNTPKQEVAYVNLRGDGSVDSIYVVNMFDLDKDGQIVDYGNYQAVRNLTSSDKLVFEDGKVTVNASAGKLYYEGKLDSTVIPWKFDIHYYMDGQEYSADEIAGKSGPLRVTMAIRQNPEGNSTFFEHYALQVTFALDNRNASNIVADGATQAVVGSDRQLVYTILPGQETDLEFTADVNDFEMSGITISALKMDLDIPDDVTNIASDSDLKKLTDGIAELDDGAQDIRDGAEKVHNRSGELADGAQNLEAGTSDLQDGANSLAAAAQQLLDGAKQIDDSAAQLLAGARDLYDGTSELHSGASSLNSGAGSLSSGLATLAAQSDNLTDGAYEVFQTLTDEAEKQLNPALQKAGLSTVTLTPETYDTVLTKLLDQLSMGTYSRSVSQVEKQVRTAVEAQVKAKADPSLSAEALQQQIDAAVAQQMASDDVQQQIRNGMSLLVALSPSLGDLVDLKAQLDRYQAFYSGLVAYTEGVSAAAQGADSLSSGTTSLESGSAEVKDGAEQLYNGMTQLKDGTSALLNGLVELQGGAVAIRDGAVEVEGGAVKLLNGAIEFRDSTVSLQEGASRLANGTAELRSKTANLKDRIKEAVDNLMGGDFTPISFVSDRDTNVEFVQFVMQTPSISVDDEETTAVETQPTQQLTFWGKVAKLFGLAARGTTPEAN